ncbi:MAG: aldolase/citrate lyase family protein [Desulfurivibrionaceae bacterium]|nr:aldolase/citrate lyase family protein [Desulfurivibrionaceae bacterium]
MSEITLPVVAKTAKADSNIASRPIWGAHLFVPANNAGFLEKLPLLTVKNIIIDMEYATKIPYKLEGRHLCKAAIGYIRQVRPDIGVAVRTNLYKAGQLFLDDLLTVAVAAPNAIRIPSVSEPSEVAHADELLSDIENTHGLLPGSIKLHPMIETPEGLHHAYAIATASPRVEALCLGGEDWAYNCGLERSQIGKELEHVKFELIAAASRAQVTPVDSVYNWINDLDGLAEDCNISFTIGMKARATINPRQIKIIDNVYKPSKYKIDWAKNLLAGLSEMYFDGRTHYISNGVINDILAISQARAILANAN